MRHSFTPVNQTMDGICMQCNILLNQIIQSHKCSRREQLNENCLIVGNKFNPICRRPSVSFGTKLKVLIAYFEEE